MTDNQMSFSDLTVEELLQLIRSAVREELRHQQQQHSLNQMALLELQPIYVGQWPQGLKLLSRDEFYDNSLG